LIFSEPAHINNITGWLSGWKQLLGIFLLFLTISASAAPAFQPVGNEQEVFLDFRYRGLVNTAITSYYNADNQQFYLPAAELFSLLEIPHKVDNQVFTIRGTIGEPSGEFLINFNHHTVTYRNETHTFTKQDFLVKELDFFVTPQVLNSVFDLTFSIDFNNLGLTLESEHPLPVDRALERKRKRERILNNRNRVSTTDHPLRYGRDRKIFNGGFLDYGLTSNINRGNNLYLYNFSLGTEILGGDLQGTALGSYTNSSSVFRTDDFRWRYVMRNNPYVTQIKVGQNISNGLTSRSHTGVQITDDPVEPRILFDEYVIEGTTTPQSEVELYSNNVLIGFQESDDLGNYRFVVPLTYGNERFRVMIYRPDGSIREIDKRFQIPFDFLPEHELDYELNIGRLDDPILGETDEDEIVQGEVSYGLTNWLTGTVGGEYLSESLDNPYVYSSLTSRISDSYLLSMDFAPDFLYRANASVIYPSSTSLSFSYSNFFGTQQPGITSNDEEIRGSVFVPFNIFSIPLNFRIFGNHAVRDDSKLTFYRMDLNANIRRLRLQAGYSDRQVGNLEFTSTLFSAITGSATYLLSRNSTLPYYLRGTFLRGEITYLPQQKQVEETEFQISRSITRTGQIQLSFGRNFLNDFSFLNLSLTLDLNKTRSTSTFRTQSNNHFFIQNFRGSVGFDNNTNTLHLDEREHVGRSASTFRLFVDENDSGDYDRGEQVIPDNAISLDKSSRNFRGDDGFLRFTQLQSYSRVNAQITKANISDPLLVPKFEQFSFVTDPNQFKPIYIPFYRSGIVEGAIHRVINDSLKRPLSGMRLHLEEVDGNYSKVMRTFTDGSYYGYEIPPGTYELSIDSTQLEFLNAESVPDVKRITIDATADGDFESGHNFNIIPKMESPPDDQPDDSLHTSPDTGQQPADEETGIGRLFPGDNFYFQVASFKQLGKAEEARKKAENHFSLPFMIYYNQITELYGVRTYDLVDKKGHIDELIAKTGQPFGEPAFVYGKQPESSWVPGRNYAVQLTSSPNVDSMRKLARHQESISGRRIHVVHLKDRDMYGIIAGPVPSQQEAKDLLRQFVPTEIDTVEIIEMDKVPAVEWNRYFRMNLYILMLQPSTVKDRVEEVVKSRNLFETVQTEWENTPVFIIKNLESWDETRNIYRDLVDRVKEEHVLIVMEEVPPVK